MEVPAGATAIAIMWLLLRCAAEVDRCGAEDAADPLYGKTVAADSDWPWRGIAAAADVVVVDDVGANLALRLLEQSCKGSDV